MDITRDFGSRILGSNPGGRATSNFIIDYRLIRYSPRGSRGLGNWNRWFFIWRHKITNVAGW